MASDGISPRVIAAGLALLGLVPPAIFIVDRNAPIIGFSLVSVLVIAASLYVMFGPGEAESHAHVDETETV